MLRSLKEKFYAVFLSCAAVTADTLSAAFDTKGLSNAGFLVTVGNFSFDGTNKVALEVQHSDDDSTYTAVAAEDLYSYETAPNIAKVLDAAGDANKVHLISYRGNKRYLKLNQNVSGTVNVPIAISGVSTIPHTQPGM